MIAHFKIYIINNQIFKSMSGILFSVLIGAIAGFIAGKIMNKSMGLLICILVGIVGGFLGSGLLYYIFKITGSGSIWWQLLVGIVGSVVLLWLISLIKKK